MRVFGIGLEKTGTTTLGKALETLGFDKQKGFDLELLRRAVNGQVAEVVASAADFNNFENYPWALLYKELYAAYPDAKFILTRRTSAFRWFNSLCHYARRTGPTEERQLVYGHAMPNLFESEDMAFYEKHLADVRTFFSANDSSRLLEVCWANEDGWDELCAFLDKPIPEMEFPHLK